MKSLENLQLFHQAGKLKKIKRAGWINNNIKFAESVADHSFRVAFISMILSKDLNVDALRLIEMSLIHDLAESIVGDITPYCGVSKTEKRAEEEKALRELLADIDNGNYWFELWVEYEDQETPEAIALKNIDKFEMALQAYEYISAEKDKDLSSFILDAKKNITLPLVKVLMKDLFE